MSEFGDHAATALETIDFSKIPADASFTFEQRVVSDATMVDQYHVTIADSTITVTPGAADAPDVVITQDPETAKALRSGELHAQGAFLTGRLSIDGDINGLLDFGPVLSQILAARGTDA